MEENLIDRISMELEMRYALVNVVEGQYIKINEFDGMINIDTYEEFEELAISVCKMITEEFDVDCDYEIIGIDGEHDLRFEIIE